MNTKLVLTTAAICLAAASANVGAKGPAERNPEGDSQVVEIKSGWAKTIPVKGWDADVDGYIAQRSQGKAATDLATVFRPVAPCRLVDTRGFPAAISGGGAIVNTRRAFNSSGLCGIPTSAVAISLGFAARNNTPNSGGTLAFTSTGAPANGLAAVFNFGSDWTSSNVITPADNGDFDVVVAQANVDIAIDVNGYFQDLDSLDLATQELDFFGNGPGDVFGITQSGTGTALEVEAPAASDSALRIGGGRIAVTGAGVDSNTAAFIHRTDATAAFGSGTGNLCSVAGFPDYSIIDHPMLNNNPSALLFITANDEGTGGLANDGPFNAFYFAAQGACTSPNVAGKWAIRDAAGVAFQTGDLYNILIINP